MRWMRWIIPSFSHAFRSRTSSTAPLVFGSHVYSDTSAVFYEQRGNLPYHALALEKEPQLSEDERQDNAVDFLLDDKLRTESLRKNRRFEEVSAVRSLAVEAESYVRRGNAEERDRVSDMLIDSHGRRHNYLRISLTERCNLRCNYCMPAKGVELTPNSELLSQKEIVRIAGTFVAGGVDKIRLTGGEPSIRSDIEEICEQLSSLPGLKHLAMTSNGIVLSRKLPRLQAAGLNQLNISLDTLVPAKFELLTRRKGHNKVLQSIDTALGLGLSPVKVNTVVMRGLNDDEILDFVELTRDKPINVRFIEFMPFDGNVWNSKKLVSYMEMMDMIKKKFPSIHRLEDHPTDTAKNFQVEGFQGTVSFITSMTQHFCSGCNRLRLMADGNLKVCLFGPAEVSLRDAIRSGMQELDLQQVISDAVKRKKAAHAGMFELARTQNRPMVHIGG
ncbi:GTP 3',8-cyclase, mitochondrial isoform X2 [Physcomitrium patens]|uniref:GTP 3',8-cyclase n=1 Tax=Physcomitrium patens TaxID=3218 RepID=A0A7I4E5S1_PHYPA|nr:GTP 3',8-cyclase, mitochondrial-like isoform X2 [Physcomitrium patens]|eukprot:XP_024376131.1 GTP 3',8-cyclase, mitochondrial-like isoform X2 [Physcomitrella patens]